MADYQSKWKGKEIDERLELATATKAGTVLAGAKTAKQTKSIGIDSDGKLYAEEEDLSTLATKTDLNTAVDGKVDKETGKGLSANDFTDALKTKLDGLVAGGEANVQSDWNQTDTTADDYIKNKPTIPEGAAVDAALSATSENPVQNKVINTALEGKVNTETGKGLSANDFTDALKTKVESIAEGAEVNVQSDWNQTDTTADDYIKNKPTIPEGAAVDAALSATSENPVQNKVINTALEGKVNTETGKGLSANDFTDALKTKLDGLVAGGEANVQSDWNQTDTSADDYIKNKPTIPEGAAVDAALSATSENPVQNKVINTALEGKVNTETGKGLSANDFTDALKTKVDGIAEGAEVNVQPDWNQTDTDADDFIKNKPTIPEGATVDAALSTTSENPVQNKAVNAALTLLTTSVANKVDKETGKGLSANDFTDALKTKVESIAEGAEVNVQSDWNQTDTTADDYIKNKPTIPEGATLATDEEDTTTVNSKIKLADKAYDTSVNSGLGRTYVRLHESDNYLLTADLPDANTIYIIQYDHDLNGKTLVVPDGCVLKFEGGSLKNGVIKGNNIIIDSSAECFDKTVIIVPDSLQDATIYLKWFKMEKWTKEQYTANHKNTSATISDTNRTIVNNHTRYKLIVPAGIFPFDDYVNMTKSITANDDTYTTGATLKLTGNAVARLASHDTLPTSFVFPKSKGFYYKEKLADSYNSNCESKISYMYFEANDNVFDFGGGYTIGDPASRPINTVTNEEFDHVDLVSINGNGYYCPTWANNWQFHNTFNHVRGFVCAENKGWFYGMPSLSNIYTNITPCYHFADGAYIHSTDGTWAGISNTKFAYSVFINSCFKVDHANMDCARHFAVWNTEQAGDYDGSKAEASVLNSNLEDFTEEIYLSNNNNVFVNVNISNSLLTYSQGQTCYPIDILKIYSITMIRNTYSIPSVDKFINNNFIADKINIDKPGYFLMRDVGIRMSNGNYVNNGADLGFFIPKGGYYAPDTIDGLYAEALKAKLYMVEPQEVSMDDLEDMGGWYLINCKSNKCHITPTSDVIVKLKAGTNSFAQKVSYGMPFYLLNNSKQYNISVKCGTNEGMFVVYPGTGNYFRYNSNTDSLCPIWETYIDEGKGTNALFPKVYTGQILSIQDKLIKITKRNLGCFVDYEWRSETGYVSHNYGENIPMIQDCSASNTCSVGTHIFWAVQGGPGITAASEPTFDTSVLGAETVDGTVTWRYMGEMPEYEVLNTYNAGDTASRPVLDADSAGIMYVDTTIGKIIFWTGMEWKDAMGATV